MSKSPAEKYLKNEKRIAKLLRKRKRMLEKWNGLKETSNGRH